MPKYVVEKPSGAAFITLPTPSILDRYQVLSADGGSGVAQDDGVHVRALGSGGFGVVIRAKDKLEIPRAIKLLKLDAIALEGSTNSFQEEIRLTNAQPFKNVITIMDYGEDKDADGNPFWFYVSPFVDGMTLTAFATLIKGQQEQIARQEIFRQRLHDQMLLLITDLLAALVELDNAAVVHMDLKPDNILLYPNTPNPLGIGDPVADRPSVRHLLPPTRLEGLVIDLGAGKAITEGQAGQTKLITTKYYFPSDRLAELGFDKGRATILKERLFTCWREIDLYSCGRILERLFLDRGRRTTPLFERNAASLAEETKKESFWRLIFADDFAVVEGIVNKLAYDPYPRPSFKSASEVKYAFETIPLKRAHGVLTSETLTDRYPGMRIRAGGSLVRIGFPFAQIVDHPAFQRLRRIQQLAFVSEIFPDGTHNRFSHSLRTYHLAKDFVLGLNRRSTFRLLFTRRDVDHILAAALLHDVGQYHFSHSIEDLRKMADLEAKRNATPLPHPRSKLCGIRHDQELAEHFINQRDSRGMSIADILHDHDLSLDDILYLIQKTEKDLHRGAVANIGRDLISGVIDVDRVSYLQQDSEHTGVPYGRAIDLASLMEAITIRHDAPGLPGAQIGLAIEEAGVSVAEAILMAVYWMYRNVYWRHTNRAFMAAIKHVMSNLLLRTDTTFDQFIAETTGRDDWHALRWLSAKYDTALADSLVDGVNPLSDLLNMRRLGYRRVFSLRFNDGDEGDLYDKIIGNISLDTESQIVQAVTQQLFGGFGVKQGEILIDVPLKRRLRGGAGRAFELEETAKEEGTKAKLWVCCRSTITRQVEDWVELGAYSSLAGRLGAIEDYSGRKIRVFVSQALLNRLPQAAIRRVETEMFTVVKESAP